MDCRLLATTKVHVPDPGRWKALVTTFPRVVRDTLGARGPGYVSMAGGGPHMVRFHAGRVNGASRVYGAKRLAIPEAAAGEMGLRGGDTINWVLAAAGGRIRVYVVRAAGGARTAARGGPVKHGGPARLLLATSLLSRPVNNYGKPYVQTSIPRQCIRVLRAEDATHVRWERRGARYGLIPCGAGDGGARRLSRTTARSKYGTCGYLVTLPGEVGSLLYAGRGSRAAWHVVADGRGRWGIEAGRAA